MFWSQLWFLCWVVKLQQPKQMTSACHCANLGRNRKLFKDAPENKERTAKLVRLDLEELQDHKAVACAICRKWARCEIKCKFLQVKGIEKRMLLCYCRIMKNLLHFCLMFEYIFIRIWLSTSLKLKEKQFFSKPYADRLTKSVLF